MPRFTLEDLDNWMENAETVTALTSLGATGATLVAPNPVTGAVAIGSNIAGAGIDLYQGIRSAIKGDYGDAAKNAGELILSLVGAKAMSSANKLYKINKTLKATGATRKTITKTIGRGAGRHKITIPVELNKAQTAHAIGFSSGVGGNASSFGGNMGTSRIEPQDNTRLETARPIEFHKVKVKKK